MCANIKAVVNIHATFRQNLLKPLKPTEKVSKSVGQGALKIYSGEILQAVQNIMVWEGLR